MDMGIEIITTPKQVIANADHNDRFVRASPPELFAGHILLGTRVMGTVLNQLDLRKTSRFEHDERHSSRPPGEFDSLGQTESKMPMNFHENFSRSTARRRSSDRAFGYIMAAFFALLGLAPLRRGAPVRLTALLVAAVFLVLGLLWPTALRPLERIWSGRNAVG